MKDKGHFLAGLLFILLGSYMLFTASYLDSAMYLALGLGFSLTGIIKNKIFPKQHSLLGIISWITILLAFFIFLFLLRTDFQ